MAWRCGSISRSLISSARTSVARSSLSSPPLRSTPVLGARVNSRRLLSTSNLGTIGGVIGCTQSLLPLHSVVAASRLTSHLSVEARACCELSQGT